MLNDLSDVYQLEPKQNCFDLSFAEMCKIVLPVFLLSTNLDDAHADGAS